VSSGGRVFSGAWHGLPQTDSHSDEGTGSGTAGQPTPGSPQAKQNPTTASPFLHELAQVARPHALDNTAHRHAHTHIRKHMLRTVSPARSSTPKSRCRRHTHDSPTLFGVVPAAAALPTRLEALTRPAHHGKAKGGKAPTVADSTQTDALDPHARPSPVHSPFHQKAVRLTLTHIPVP
jgi:hypothetical protein